MTTTKRAAWTAYQHACQTVEHTRPIGGAIHQAAIDAQAAAYAAFRAAH